MSMNGRRVRWAVALVVGVAVLAGLVGPAAAAEKVSIRLKWTHQAQFAGYYVAQEKGWYKAEGLEVTINAAGPTLRPEPLVAAGTDTFGVSDTVTQITSREKELPLVQIATIFEKNPLYFVTKKKSGISRWEDFRGKRVGMFFTGIQYQARGILKKYGVAPGSYTEVPMGQTITAFIDDQVDAVTVTNYNEYLVVLDKGVKDLNVFSFAEQGFNIPRDGIIVHEKTLSEKPQMVQGFLRASVKGWQWTLDNQKEAVDVVMKMNPNLTRAHQEAQMAELVNLIKFGEALTRGLGYQDPKDWEFAMRFMLENDLLKKPVDLSKAYTNALWEKVPLEDKRIK